MKSALVFVAIFTAMPGCALISAPHSKLTQTPIDFSELPTPVIEKLESENRDPPIRIWEIEGSGVPYYQLDFKDGSYQRFNPDGTVNHRGLI